MSGLSDSPGGEKSPSPDQSTMGTLVAPNTLISSPARTEAQARQDAFSREMSERQLVKHETFGDGSRCGARALAIAIADILPQDSIDCPVQFQSSQHDIFEALNNVLNSQECDDALKIAHELAGSSTEDVPIHVREFLSGDTLAILLKEYCVQTDVAFNLVMTTEVPGTDSLTSYFIYQHEDQDNAKNLFVFCNSSNTHYEGYARLRTQSDKSTGKVPDITALKYKYDPRNNRGSVPISHVGPHTCVDDALSRSARKAAKKAARDARVADDETCDEDWSSSSASDTDESDEDDENDSHDADQSQPSLDEQQSPISIAAINNLPTFNELKDGTRVVSNTQQLVILNNPSPKDEAWKGVKKSFETGGRIKFPSRGRRVQDGPPGPAINSIPRNTHVNPSSDGIQVVVSIHSIDLNPSVRVEVNIWREVENKYIVRCHMDFPFAPVWSFEEDKMLYPMKNLKAEMDEDRRFLTLSFQTGCVVPHRLVHIASDPTLISINRSNEYRLSDKEIDDLRELADLIKYPNEREVLVQFNIGPDDVKYEELLSKLPTKDRETCDPCFTKLRWSPYRNSRKNVTIQHNNMKGRLAILSRGHPGLPLPASIVPVDRDEFLVTRGFGAHLELQEHLAFVRAISMDPHSLKLYSISNHVYAAISWSKLPNVGIPGERFNLTDGTQINLKINQGTLLEGRPNRIEANGMVIVDQFGLPSHDVLVFIPYKDASFFGSLQEPLVGAELRPAKEPPRLTAILSIKPSERTYSFEIDAVQKIMTAEACARWIPLMLFNGKELPCFDPLHGVPKNIRRDAWLRLKQAVRWTKRQWDVIKSIKKMPGRVLLVQAPPGCGKTTLAKHITRYLWDCGLKVLFSGAMNDTLDFITMELPEEVDPIRVYPTSQESLSSFSPNTATPELDSRHESYVHLQTCHRLMQQKQKRRHGLTERTVTWKLIKNLNRGPLMATFTESDDNGLPVQRQKEDVRAYFRDRFEKLTKYTPWDKEQWTDEKEVKFLDQAYVFLRNEVAREARVIVCTNHVAGDTFVRQNFAWDATETRGVVVIQDEAHSILEPQAIIPLSRTVDGDAGGFAHNVVAFINFGDREQIDGFVLSRNGWHNTTNEFVAQRGMSLFTRLIAAGFPVHTLNEQRRSHPFLMELVNKYHYNLEIQSGKSWPLAPKYQDLLPNIIGIDPKELTARGFRMAWLHTKYGVPLVNPNTGSRINMTDLALVEQILLPAFRKAFNLETYQECGIGVPYNYMKEELMRRFQSTRIAGWKDEELPELQCIDSFKGKEKKVFVVVLVNNGQNEGFLKDKKRACVMFSRAVEVQIVVGGDFFPTLDDPNGKKKAGQETFMKTLIDPTTKEKIVFNTSSACSFYFEQHSGYELTHVMEVDADEPPPGLRLVAQKTIAGSDTEPADAGAGSWDPTSAATDAGGWQEEPPTANTANDEWGLAAAAIDDGTGWAPEPAQSDSVQNDDDAGHEGSENAPTNDDDDAGHEGSEIDEGHVEESNSVYHESDDGSAEESDAFDDHNQDGQQF